jgi:serine/threonine protein kinase
MSNRSLDHVLRQMRQAKRPLFLSDTGVSMFICGVVANAKFMHSPGIDYPDLRPASILIDSNRRSRLEDLDTSNFIESTTCLSSNYQGTVRYQAPELCGELSSAEKVDVFSLTLVLSEILIGRLVCFVKLSELHIKSKIYGHIRVDLAVGVSDDAKSLIIRHWSEHPAKLRSFNENLAELKRIRFSGLSGVDLVAVSKFFMNSPSGHSTEECRLQQDIVIDLICQASANSDYIYWISPNQKFVRLNWN